ncbi:Phophatidylserine decarboxylase-domain-containing protein [Mycena vitilis]|nr:Phophatidylserine decarboxylase-domain-containing protein [Mycena vitilis]
MVHQNGDDHHFPYGHKETQKSGSRLPVNYRVQYEWIWPQVEHVDKYGAPPLVPVLLEFQKFIESNARIYMYFTRMWDEVPRCASPGKPQIRDYRHMLDVLNYVLTKGPEWTEAAAGVGMVGVPIQGIFFSVMGTPSGNAAFLDPAVNKMLKKVLNEWGKFLKSPESAVVLGDHSESWLGPSMQDDIMHVANAPLGTNYKFEDFYICDPTKKHYGYACWDDFFTRKFHEGVRPVASPEDDSVIANSCESKVYNLEYNAALRAKFFIKGQPYSVLDMLAHDPLAVQFAGATIYQAFLCILSYHRWHAPVRGRVVRAFVQEGTYFSEPLFEETEEPSVADIDTISAAQGYLTALATRAVIFIQADNADIGLMAFIAVGMDEVSTCEITVQEGDRVEKGEQLGMFHFGGSSHCLLFRKEVRVEGFPERGRIANVPVRSQVAVVRKD